MLDSGFREKTQGKTWNWKKYEAGVELQRQDVQLEEKKYNVIGVSTKDVTEL